MTVRVSAHVRIGGKAYLRYLFSPSDQPEGAGLCRSRHRNKLTMFEVSPLPRLPDRRVRPLGLPTASRPVLALEGRAVPGDDAGRGTSGSRPTLSCALVAVF